MFCKALTAESDSPMIPTQKYKIFYQREIIFISICLLLTMLTVSNVGSEVTPNIYYMVYTWPGGLIYYNENVAIEQAISRVLCGVRVVFCYVFSVWFLFFSRYSLVLHVLFYLQFLLSFLYRHSVLIPHIFTLRTSTKI